MSNSNPFGTNKWIQKGHRVEKSTSFIKNIIIINNNLQWPQKYKIIYEPIKICKKAYAKFPQNVDSENKFQNAFL